MNQQPFEGGPAVTVLAVTRTMAAAHMIRVRAVPDRGAPGITFAGLPNTGSQTTHDRVRAAVVNSGLDWPHQGLTLSVFPHDMPAADAGLDAAFAVAVLAATGQLPGVRLAELAVADDLDWDGRLRPVSDVATRLAVVAGPVAWTVADLAGHAQPTAADLAEAIQLRTCEQAEVA